MNATQALGRMRQVIRCQHNALATELRYRHWLRRHMAALLEMAPTLSSERKLERLLSDLAVKRDVTASTQHQTFNAIDFFYKDVLCTPLHDAEALRATRP